MNLRQKTMISIYWAGSAQFVQFSSRFIVTAILARMLQPGDFGIVAMANIFIGLITSINDRGWGSAIIQHRKISDAHCHSVFWLNILFSCVCMGLLFALSPVIALFFEQPDLEAILNVLTISFVFDAFVIVQRALNMKRLNYKLLALIDMVAWTAGGLIGIGCALNDFGVWSLVLQMIAIKFIAAVLLWTTTRWKPGFYFSTDKVKDLFSFSIYMNGNVILNVVLGNIDFLLIGKLLGAEALGFYTLAFKLMMLPVRNISWIVSKVIFPAFSSIQTNITKVRTSYLYTVRMVSLTAFPVVGCIFLSVPEFITIVLGSQWQPATSLIRILCVLSLVKSISILASNISFSQGKADLQLKIRFIDILVTAGAITLGTPWGITGAVISYTIANILWFPVMTAWIHQMVHIGFVDYINAFFRQVLYLLGLLAAAGTVKAFFVMPDIVSLIVVPGCACAAYGLLLYSFEQEFFRSVFRNKS